MQGDTAQRRLAYSTFTQYYAGTPIASVSTEDLLVTGRAGQAIKIRVYRPEERVSLDKKLSAVIYFHGGGWLVGDIATHDSVCRNLCFASGCVIISVEWRLTPEYVFPAGIEDGVDVYDWLLKSQIDDIDINNICLAGDSAGGNIVAAIFQQIKHYKIQPKLQLLLYASLDFTCSSSSYRDRATGYFLTTERTKYYIDNYIREPSDITNPLFSPIFQEDFSYLPRTHIVSAGFDPIRGDSDLYAKKLEAAGVNVSLCCYEDLIHAFLHFVGFPRIQEVYQQIGSVIKDTLR